HSPTADYHINFGMALVAWVAYQTEGFRHLKLDYPKRWFNLSGFKDGPVIGAIFILVGFIELFSELFRVLTLTLRLWGNVLGGEIMLIVMSGLFLVPGLALPFVGLEVFIGLVQGLVFALLVLMYFVLAIESHDEEHEEGSRIDRPVPDPLLAAASPALGPGHAHPRRSRAPHPRRARSRRDREARARADEA